MAASISLLSIDLDIHHERFPPFEIADTAKAFGVNNRMMLLFSISLLSGQGLKISRG
jgi:hypothetical protein